jgi:hypothetical protein
MAPYNITKDVTLLTTFILPGVRTLKGSHAGIKPQETRMKLTTHTTQVQVPNKINLTGMC